MSTHPEPLQAGKPNQQVFADTLLALAETDPSILVVTSDSRGSGRLVAFGEKLPRLEAKGMIEIACKKAINEKRHLRDIIAADPRISVHLDAATLEKLFDPSTYLGATDAMIERALTLYSLHFGQ